MRQGSLRGSGWDGSRGRSAHAGVAALAAGGLEGGLRAAQEILRRTVLIRHGHGHADRNTVGMVVVGRSHGLDDLFAHAQGGHLGKACGVLVAQFAGR